MSDDRMKHIPENGAAQAAHDHGDDGRAAVAAGDGRETRAEQARDERPPERAEDTLAMLTSSSLNEILPDLPPIPGFHTIWLSTTNQYDPIHRRLRLGYQPVKIEDLPKAERDRFSQMRIQTGERAGMIACNEMVAFKLPMKLYNAYMKHLHHDEPAEEEGRIREIVEQMKGDERSPVEEYDGMKFDRKRAPTSW